MCTLTLLPQANGLLVTMNRDERRDRHEGNIAEKHQAGIRYCYPTDAETGGTWAGVNDKGIALCLLNNYQAPINTQAHSRGDIIPKTLAQGNYANALRHLKQLKAAQYNGFDCFLISAQQIHQFSWDGSRYTEQELDVSNAYMHTSSSKDLTEVSAYRQTLFKQWRATKNINVSEFHLGQVATEKSSAVLMSRQPTHTKSLVQMHLNTSQTTLAYYKHPQQFANKSLVAATPDFSWDTASITADITHEQ